MYGRARDQRLAWGPWSYPDSLLGRVIFFQNQLSGNKLRTGWSSRKMSSKSSSSSTVGRRCGAGFLLHVSHDPPDSSLGSSHLIPPWHMSPLDLSMTLHVPQWSPPTLCLLPWSPHLSPEAAAPLGPPDSGPQTHGSSSGKRRCRLVHSGHDGSSPHTIAPLGSPGAQPHSTFAPALSRTCSLQARVSGTEEGLGRT